ncbi:hypothetical protein ODJ79_05700 [Actinoplanes sp. KI2]|uniref:hypothetical protein n=1 Tax=Actinoplanes sp. KI2 TaxID=2983315 RepID=UPI0021D609FC|nr:hypothetical protein [Actinoplanes sp. KI2]MCU7723201.1 hypothetical protein [Actinoplanes sp. KI2]
MFVVVRAATRQSLKARVDGLGELRGRTMASIIATLGEPDEITRYSDDTRIMLWTSPKYQIALLAGANGMCGGVHMERSSKKAPPRQGRGQMSVGFTAWTDV